MIGLIFTYWLELNQFIKIDLKFLDTPLDRLIEDFSKNFWWDFILFMPPIMYKNNFILTYWGKFNLKFSLAIKQFAIMHISLHLLMVIVRYIIKVLCENLIVD